MDRQGRIGRETAGAVLLAALLLLGLLTAWDMESTHRQMARQLEDAAWLALSEDWENARMACASAESRWEDHRSIACLLADHTPMEQIDALFARLGICSAARDREEFAAACAELSRYVLAMGEAHHLSWQNLL